jgi:Spy/CpxP family protein refolding chaperone
MALKDVIKAVSPVAMIADQNPDMLRAFGVAGNIAANKLEDREERKRRDAEMAAGVQPQGAAPMPMKKGGKVSSASKRADGCAIRGKTRA